MDFLIRLGQQVLHSLDLLRRAVAPCLYDTFSQRGDAMTQLTTFLPVAAKAAEPAPPGTIILAVVLFALFE